MTGDQHFDAAENELRYANSSEIGPEADYHLRAAQVHATLANAIWQKAMADAVAEHFA